MKTFVLLLCAFVLSNSLHAQTDASQVKGKIVADLSALDGISVINKRTELSVVTTIGGYFKIPAEVGDTLIFSSTQTIADQVVLKSEDFNDNLLFVNLQILVNQLDEVIVKRYRNITSESLGLVSANQKKYTPAERKYNTASNPYAQVGLGGSAGLDPVLNWMSGRSAMLKKEVEIEKKESWLEILQDKFDTTYVAKLQIPSDYITGFYRYCIENVNFVKLLRAGNKGLTEFHMAELAQKYLDIIALESK